MSSPLLTSEGLAPALGRLASGLFVVTMRHEEQTTGMLASWVMQAGFEPPMLTLAVKKSRYYVPWLAEGSPFLVHVIGEGQKELLKHFGAGFDPGVDAFAGLACQLTDEGLPLLEAAPGCLRCQVRGFLDSDDHRIFLAEITAGRWVEDLPPMVHVRRNGLKY